MLKVKVFSIRDNEPRGTLKEDFPNKEAVENRVPQLLHGITSYCSISVYENGTRVGRGWRNGPNGTGESWDWSWPEDS